MKKLVFMLAVSACSTEEVVVETDATLARMLSQPRYDAYELSDFFANGRTMQVPPEGTLTVDAELDPTRAQGYVGTQYVERNPLPMTRELLERGRERYDIHCAPCHGVLGDGVSVVGRNMALVRPRSLLIERVTAAPDGRIYRVVSEGYGLMAGYAPQLSIEERWAVVAYVRALGLSQSQTLAELPVPLRERAQKELPR